ncbi:hypothetical protein SDC9_151574 [bioreactor metagenome]|uniref:Uncharacterized protein n=1 Tax=bioreactor metagenome TaxID=1076179 RepID=A0A645ER79_9ZZZZ
MNAVVLRDFCVFTVGGDACYPSGAVIPESVERALDVVFHELSGAEGGAPVAAFVINAVHVARLVAPENQFFRQTGHADEFVLFDLLGIEYGIPLVFDHGILLFEEILDFLHDGRTKRAWRIVVFTRL